MNSKKLKVLFVAVAALVSSLMAAWDIVGPALDKALDAVSDVTKSDAPAPGGFAGSLADEDAGAADAGR